MYFQQQTKSIAELTNKRQNNVFSDPSIDCHVVVNCTKQIGTTSVRQKQSNSSLVI